MQPNKAFAAPTHIASSIVESLFVRALGSVLMLSFGVVRLSVYIYKRRQTFDVLSVIADHNPTATVNERATAL